MGIYEAKQFGVGIELVPTIQRISCWGRSELTCKPDSYRYQHVQKFFHTIHSFNGRTDLPRSAGAQKSPFCRP